MPDAPRTRARWLPVAVVVAACLPYWFTLHNYFVQDDFGVVQLFANRPWTMFPRWFMGPWTENIWGYTPDEIRPFVAFTYQLTGSWNPARPELHHLFNIVLHAGNALLVMAIARTVIALSPLGAMFAGIIFAVLPGQAESVAWVTGRVDSMPAFFYLATFFMYARWRQTHHWSAYATALALFFVALFSKQNTITMVATLAAYDWFMLTRRERGTRLSAIPAWVPFGILTAGFLLLRRWLFGMALRSGLNTRAEVETLLAVLGHHVRRTVTGQLAPLTAADIAGAAFVVFGLAVLVFRSAPATRATFIRALAVFGVMWFAIGLAPVALALYESERHAYLASAGWAFTLALVIDGLWQYVNRPVLRRTVAACGAAFVIFYSVRLVPVLEKWTAFAVISEAAVERAQGEAAEAPDGALMIVGVPRTSWEWSAPFVLEPPYAPAGLVERVHLVTPWRLHCCGPALWNDYTRMHLRAWMATSPRPPIIAWRVAADTGAFSRLTDAEFPELREIIPVLLETGSADALDSGIIGILDRIVAGHPEPNSQLSNSATSKRR